MNIQRRRALTLVSASLLAMATGARANSAYPAKLIRLIVGFPPGGPTDIVARLLAVRLRQVLGQQVVVENRAGAAGNIAAEAVAKAAPDGYTLLYASSSIAISPALYERLPFDVSRDFAPITETVSVPMGLLVNPSLPAKTLAEFVRYAKDNPGKLNYASSGNGTITHLAAALFTQRNGLQTQHVPYKGTSPALVDLISGNVQFTIGTIDTALPFIRDGKLRPLAVAGLSRVASLPQVPTLDESGMIGFEASAWQGILAPVGTPDAIVQRLASELIMVMQNAEFRAQMALHDAEVKATSPQRFTQHLSSEIAKWTQVVKDTGTKAS